MNNTAKLFILLGSLLCALVVMFGAYGAHADLNTASASLFETAKLYHALHSLGLLTIGSIALRFYNKYLLIAGVLMICGILLFSGTLYLRALGGHPAVSALTPLGGLCFILSWLLLALAAYKASS